MRYSRLMMGLALAALAVLVVAPVATAQSTQGAIEGRVVDGSGEPLPGVSVTVSSPALIGGPRTVVTGPGGAYRVVSLPPGVYEVEFQLQSYQTVDQQGVRVNIGASAEIDATMTSEFTEEIRVTSDAPVVDTQSTEVGVSVGEDFFTKLPTGRNYTSVADVAPGAQEDDSGQTFYGSTGAENAYYINGVNTTGVELGQQGKELNFEFIEDVQVRTGSYNAEYGGSTGGIIEVITKSGGNEFHGDVFGYWDDEGLRSNLSNEAEEGALSGSSVVDSTTRADYGVGIGGYFVEDKLWYYAAYDRVDNEEDNLVNDDFTQVGGPAQGTILTTTEEADFYAGKLTWLLNPRHTIAGTLFGDPRTTEGPLTDFFSLAAPQSHWLGSRDRGADDYTFTYDGVLSDSTVVTARYSSHNEEDKLTGAGKELIDFIDQSDPLGDGTILHGWTGSGDPGFGFFQDQEFGRDQYGADFTWFVNDVGGDHELKAGVLQSDVSVDSANNNSGGQRIYRFDCIATTGALCEGGNRYFYRHRYYLQVASATKDPTTLTTADINHPFVVSSEAENTGYFLQDVWRPLSNLTLNVGARWEQQSLFNGDGEEHYTFDDSGEIAPRVGLIWDPMNDGRSKVFAHYGHFYEIIPMDIVIRSFGGEVSVFTYNYSFDPNNVAHDPTTPVASRPLGGGFSDVDPGTSAQYIEEMVIGGEYEVRPNMAVGLKYIKRDLENIVEDALGVTDEGLVYFIGNPGERALAQNIDFGGNVHPVPVPTREFEGVELTLQKRPTRNFSFLASLLYSELTGSYDGLFQASTGQLDPNLNSAFDYFDFSVNNTGDLSNDREWQAKFDGYYSFDMGLTTGLSARFRSGLPITAFGYSANYQNWEFYLSDRGAFGTTDDEFEMDLHLSYPFRFANGFELTLLADVFNLLDQQGETGRDMRFTDGQERDAYTPVDYSNGSLRPPITPGDASRPPTNASWNTANDWQDPRSVRLGARFSW